MRSRIIAKLFNDHRSFICSAGIMIIDRPLQLQGNIALQAKAQHHCNHNHHQEPHAPQKPSRRQPATARCRFPPPPVFP